MKKVLLPNEFNAVVGGSVCKCTTNKNKIYKRNKDSEFGCAKWCCTNVVGGESWEFRGDDETSPSKGTCQEYTTYPDTRI